MSQCVSLVLAAGLVGLAAIAQAQEDFALQTIPTASGFELRWPTGAGRGGAEPTFELQYSADCAHWRPIASNITGTNGWASCQIIRTPETVFFRVKNTQPLPLTGDGGAEVFGYARNFSQKLARLDWITPEQFAAAFPSGADYLPQIDFDPATAAYWSQVDEQYPLGYDAPPVRSFHMTAPERAVFDKLGFVVSGRMGAATCTDMYYEIYRRDLPVFISADAVLHAWHRSYDAMVKDLERTYLANSLGTLLDAMAAQIPALNQAYGAGPLKTSVLDADYYLTVGRSLLAGTNVGSALGQNNLVADTLDNIARLEIKQIDLFGRLSRYGEYWFDFSQFKPRSHYADSPYLSRYFQAMMWCGYVDFRVAGNTNYASPRELGTAMVLARALRDSGRTDTWEDIDRLLQTLVGPVDSMTFSGLEALLGAAGNVSLADVHSTHDLAAIQEAIEAGDLGFQQITSGIARIPFSRQQFKPPRSFTVLGQRFVQDSWAMGQVVYDKVFWTNNNRVVKVPRRIPSALDVAFSVFGNDQIVPQLVARMKNPQGRLFRDGLPYQRNLAAVRQTLDSQSDYGWTNNLYNGWLMALRQLSAPTTDPEYPQCMRTHAWAMKTLNTQLASWTELRHDTVLYAKQSETGGATCSYPAGFVEPRVAFWRQLEAMAKQAQILLADIPMSGKGYYTDPLNRLGLWETDLGGLKTNQLTYLSRFADVMGTLAILAEKELRQESFTDAENQFLRQTVETAGSGYRNYSGWYPRLYYRDTEGLDRVFYQIYQAELGLKDYTLDCVTWDALVTDVHTDWFDDITGDPGMVLHEGIGDVGCLIAAIDSGPDRCLYLGPVLNHYEFEEPLGTRLSDQEWKNRLKWYQYPAAPEWTSEYYFPCNETPYSNP